MSATKAPPTIFQTAADYVSAGLSIIPIRPDGTKAAAVAWDAFQSHLPTDTDIRKWFSAERNGIAILCGAVSGYREVIDFDSTEAFEQFRILAEVEEQTVLLKRLVLVKTPRPGYQITYRCPDGIEGNQKLAYSLLEIPESAQVVQKGRREYARVGDEDLLIVTDEMGRRRGLKCVIETRGEGGYTLAPGSPAACHPTGRLYKTIHGDLCQIPTITAAERDTLLDLARTLNEQPVEGMSGKASEPTKRRQEATQIEGEGTYPGADYNVRGDVRAILQQHGWKRMRGGTVEYWQRPGKSGRGWSATVKEVEGVPIFCNFSSSAAPFDIESETGCKAYAPFAVYAELEHGGDYNAAGSALYKLGFGTRLTASAVEFMQDDEEQATEPETPLETAPKEAEKTGSCVIHELHNSAPIEHKTPEFSDIKPQNRKLQKRLSDFGVKALPLGLKFERELTTSEWAEVGSRLIGEKTVTACWYNFALADYYNSLPNMRGVRKDWVVANFSFAMFQQFRNASSVARVWTPEKRHDGIRTWRFYALTAKKYFTDVERQDFALRYVAARKTPEKNEKEELLAEIVALCKERAKPARKEGPEDLEMQAPPTGRSAHANFNRADFEQGLFLQMDPDTIEMINRVVALRGQGAIKEALEGLLTPSAPTDAKCTSYVISPNDRDAEADEAPPADTVSVDTAVLATAAPSDGPDLILASPTDTLPASGEPIASEAPVSPPAIDQRERLRGLLMGAVYAGEERGQHVARSHLKALAAKEGFSDTEAHKALLSLKDDGLLSPGRQDPATGDLLYSLPEPPPVRMEEGVL